MVASVHSSPVSAFSTAESDGKYACRYQRLLAQEYDRKLKEAKRKGKIRFNVHETVDGQAIDTHNSQSSLMGRESSTPSVSTSGFNYNDFVAETGQSAASGVESALCFYLHVALHQQFPKTDSLRLIILKYHTYYILDAQ